ncbi:hypothetical protein I4U23_000349 [Adineta vaga]|nr:hypothetical protein I4U23_000349 [Adineta vaga]
MSINMTAPPQQQLAPVDHHYFEWSKQQQQQQQQTNYVHPSMSYTNRKAYYDEKCSLEDYQFNENQTIITSSLNSSNNHIRKKQKLNETDSLLLNSKNEQNHLQSCYPFQAELTQKIDIECASNNNTSGQTIHPPTHHFTLSTVINVSVNGQSQKLPSSSHQQNPMKSSDLIPYSDSNFSLYLKDIDLSTLDRFILPTCPNPQDYLTVDGLLTFLMSDKHTSNQLKYPMQQIYNYPQTPSYHQQHSYPPYQMSQMYNSPQENSNLSMLTNEPGTSSYYRQSSFSQKYYPSFR